MPLKPKKVKTETPASAVKASLQNQTHYLEVLETCISESEASQITGIGRDTVRRWRKDNPDFMSDYERLHPSRMRNLEEGMWAALEWGLRPENYAVLFRYPSLLQFALRGGLPEKYADRTMPGHVVGQTDLKAVLGMDTTMPQTVGRLPELGPPKTEETADWLKDLEETFIHDPIGSERSDSE